MKVGMQGGQIIRVKLKVEATIRLRMRMRIGGDIKEKMRVQVMTELASDKGKGGDERMDQKLNDGKV